MQKAQTETVSLIAVAKSENVYLIESLKVVEGKIIPHLHNIQTIGTIFSVSVSVEANKNPSLAKFGKSTYVIW